MMTVEAWTTIRYLRAQGKSIRAVAREVSVSRNTLRAALRQEHPPQYQRPRRPNPKLGPYLAQIEDMLTEKHFIGTGILRELRKVAYHGARTALYDHLRTLKGELVDPRVCLGAALTLTCIIGRVSHFPMGNTNQRLDDEAELEHDISQSPSPRGGSVFSRNPGSSSRRNLQPPSWSSFTPFTTHPAAAPNLWA